MKSNSNPDASSNGKITSGKNVSFWTDRSPSMIYEKVQMQLETEILIIGGGISGLSTAYLLTKKGKKVILVEDGYLGSGESGRTTAHISYALDDRYYAIEKVFGAEKTKMAAASHISAIRWIEQVIAEEKIECNFKKVNGYLFLHPSDEKDNLQKEFDACRRAGLPTEMMETVPFLTAEERNKSIMFPDQAQFHILQYLNGLAAAIVRNGGKIYTESKATDINKNGAKVNGYEIKANHIVVATNTPVNDFFTMHTKQWPYRTYVAGFKIRKDAYPYALWWDTGDADSKWVSQPYHYVRLEPFDEYHDLLICGGEDHKTGQSEAESETEKDRYNRLHEWVAKRFPGIGDLLYNWSGQVMEPVDYLAFIGRNPGDDNIYIITGDSGNGMTHSAIGAMLLTDLMEGKENPWEALYNPSRITVGTGDDYLKEVGNMARQFTDWITPGDIKQVTDLKPGEGGILRNGIKKTGVYKDDSGCLHACSAVCPHMGGILQWNSDEKTFDCPMHGSRFTTGGKVINGPATMDLESIEIKEITKASE